MQLLVYAATKLSYRFNVAVRGYIGRDTTYRRIIASSDTWLCMAFNQLGRIGKAAYRDKRLNMPSSACDLQTRKVIFIDLVYQFADARCKFRWWMISPSDDMKSLSYPIDSKCPETFLAYFGPSSPFITPLLALARALSSRIHRSAAALTLRPWERR